MAAGVETVETLSPWSDWRRGRSHAPGKWTGHYRTRRARDQAAEAEAANGQRRAAFHATRDAAYRQALGLGADDELPAAIGQTIHNRAPMEARYRSV